MKNNKMVRINILFPPDMLKELRAVGERRGLSLASVIRLYLSEYLEKKKEERKG
jgi:metal-responsive CopG/Arc/MetJ family transcriptional regulator